MNLLAPSDFKSKIAFCISSELRWLKELSLMYPVSPPSSVSSDWTGLIKMESLTSLTCLHLTFSLSPRYSGLPGTPGI